MPASSWQSYTSTFDFHNYDDDTLDDYLGIDQGLTVAMIENFRSGLIWRIMRGNPYVRRGLERAGFQGGKLDTTG